MQNNLQETVAVPGLRNLNKTSETSGAVWGLLRAKDCFQMSFQFLGVEISIEACNLKDISHSHSLLVFQDIDAASDAIFQTLIERIQLSYSPV